MIDPIVFVLIFGIIALLGSGIYIALNWEKKG